MSNRIKIALIGEAGVGKTNLIQISIGKEFEHNSESSSTCSYVEKEHMYNDKKYIFDLWDTAGQEVYRSLNKLFVKNSKIVIIVFAINVKNSFNQIDFWYNYIKEVLGEEDYIIALVGNKADLYEEQEISDKDIEKKAKELNIKYKITSAIKDADGFKEFLAELMNDYIQKYNPAPGGNANSFKIEGDKGKKKKKKGCC